MERKEIEEKVKAFLIDELEVEEEKIAPEALLKEDIGIDSLDLIFRKPSWSTRSRT